MSEKDFQIDSGMLQFVPKGAYYEDQNEQIKAINDTWSAFFNYDRTLFCLTTLLNGTGFSKGAMSHMLLSNPQAVTGREIVPAGLAFDYESKVIMYNLIKERTPRALKNLLMLAGKEGKRRVNNSRTRHLILEYVFNRDHHELDNLAINYKGKLKTLIRHALGKQELTKILFGDHQLFMKRIGRYHPDAFPVICYVFNRPLQKNVVYTRFAKIDQVQELSKAAKAGDVDSFKKHMKGLPNLTVMGYRNTYKIPVELSIVYEKAKMGSRQSLQMESAAKKAGTKIKVNYKNQDIYDLWKAFYHKVTIGDQSNIKEVTEAIRFKMDSKKKIDIGEVVIVIDASKSMQGSDTRPLHPFLTALSISSMISNVKDVLYVGGKIHPQTDGVIIPSGATDLWRGLVEAVLTGTKKIIVISDGYENSVKGLFDHVYKHFKKSGHDFELMHINPVMSADAKSGTVRKLTEDVTPLPVSSHKYLETEIIFNQMIENREIVKQLLIGKYKNLIGG